MIETTKEAIRSPEDVKKEADNKLTLEIIKDFDELKMKFNDALSFEAQYKAEKDEDNKESLRVLYVNKTRKTRAFLAVLDEKIQKRFA